MNEVERREYQQALRAMQDRTEALDQLITEHAGNIARVIVALDMLPELVAQIDQVIAWVHGANRLPDMTPGAQAIKCKTGATREPF